MTHPSATSGVFRRPFNEQVAFFRRKLGKLVPTERWDDMLGAAHDDAFMVAGATEADLLADLAAAVDKAIAEGKGIDAFRKDFRAIVGRHGWTGWTGEGSVQGEAWRVKTILRTNSYSSYSAGRLAQLREGNFKYWVYRHGGSLEPRVQHLSWNGLALAPDHVFWDTHYPPSDWGCSCYVIGARTEAAIKRVGGDPNKTLPAGWNARDPKTGAPVGIGRGWDYAPGATVSPLISAMAQKVRNWDFQVAKAFLGQLPAQRAEAISAAYRDLPSTADDTRRYAQRVEAPQPDLPELSPVRTMGMVGDSGAAAMASFVQGKDVAAFDYVIDAGAVRHALNKHGGDDIALTSADFAFLPFGLNRPTNIAQGVLPRGAQPDKTLPRVLIAFEANGLKYESVWEVRAGRRSLYLMTYYVVGRAK